jgi:predicted RecB family nuclease
LRRSASVTTQAPTSYAAGSLISVGHGRSVHLATRAGRFGKAIAWGATSCGVKGIARPPVVGGVQCGNCARDSAYRLAFAAAEAAALPPTWVTKTDISRYLRCPYAWYLQDRSEISFEDTVDEFQMQLINAGLRFHTEVEREAAPIELPEQGLPGLFDQELTVLGVPDFENRELLIRGRPDGIVTARGALLPVEIKSHKDVQRIDELELAFYWLLLEPQRTRRVRRPRGLLILRREGREEPVEVEISRERLAQVRKLIIDVRKARAYGVRPRVCGCQVCSRLRQNEVARVTERNKDLTLLYGIGRHYAPVLEEAGIRSWEDLLDRDSAEVVEILRDRGMFVSPFEVDCWKRHAESWQRRKPVVFGATRCVCEPFLALDLEYPSVGDGPIWLVGARLADGEEGEYFEWWADTRAEEERALLALDELVAAHPTLPLVTWAGASADLPRLERACAGLDLPHLDAAIRDRHVDLFVWTRGSLRLPRPTLDLKRVAAYFGVPRFSPIGDGMAAEMLYGRYLSSRDAQGRAELRRTLCDYNRDDLDALVEVARRLRELTLGDDRYRDDRARESPRGPSPPKLAHRAAGLREPARTSDPAAELNRTVVAELERYPRGPKGSSQNRFRSLYQMTRSMTFYQPGYDASVCEREVVAEVQELDPSFVLRKR